MTGLKLNRLIIQMIWEINVLVGEVSILIARLNVGEALQSRNSKLINYLKLSTLII